MLDYHNDFVVPLYRGDFDSGLDGMIQTIMDYKKSKAPKIWEFQVGDRVRLVNCNPKYLNGQMATVKKINRTKVVIDLDNRVNRFYTNITTPLAMVERI
jgi:hypothetical protein